MSGVNSLFSPDEVREIVNSEEFASWPFEEREQVVSGAIREASDWVQQNEGWNPESVSRFTAFANEVRGKLKESKTWGDTGKEALGTVGRVLKDSAATLATAAGDLGVVNADGSMKLPLENVGTALATNLSKLGTSINETLGAVTSETDNRVELGVEAIKTAIDAGEFPMDGEGFRDWVQSWSEDLAEAQAEWVAAEDWGGAPNEDQRLFAQSQSLVGNPKNLGLLAAYVKTRDPEAMDQLRKNLLVTPARVANEEREAVELEESKYAQFLERAFGEGASRYISEAGDPFEIAGTIFPVLKGAKAVGRGLSLVQRAGQLAQGVAGEVLSEQGSLFMDDPFASGTTRAEVAKDAAIGALGLAGAGAGGKAALDAVRGAREVSTEDVAAEAGVVPADSAVAVAPVELVAEAANAAEVLPVAEVVQDAVAVDADEASEVVPVPEAEDVALDELMEFPPPPPLVREVPALEALAGADVLGQVAEDPVIEAALEESSLTSSNGRLGPGASGVNEWAKSRFGQRIKARDDVKAAWHKAFEPGSYRVRSEAEWVAQSQLWIDQMGLDAAAEMVYDPESGIEGSDRVALAGALMERVDNLAYEAELAGDAGVAKDLNEFAGDLAHWLSLNGSKAGQEVRAYGLLVKESPALALHEFEVKRTDGLNQQMEKELGVTADSVNAAVETEAAPEIEAAVDEVIEELEAVAAEVPLEVEAVAETSEAVDEVPGAETFEVVAVEDGSSEAGGKGKRDAKKDAKKEGEKRVPPKKKARSIAERVEALIEGLQKPKVPTAKRVDELMELVDGYRKAVNDQFVPTLVGWEVPQERAQVLAGLLDDERALKAAAVELAAQAKLRTQAQAFLAKLTGAEAPVKGRKVGDFRAAIAEWRKDASFDLVGALSKLGIAEDVATQIHAGLVSIEEAKALAERKKTVDAQVKAMIERLKNPKEAAKREVSVVRELAGRYLQDDQVDFLAEAEALGFDAVDAAELRDLLDLERAKQAGDKLAAERAALDAKAQELIDGILDPKVVAANPRVKQGLAKLKEDFLNDPSIDVVAEAMALGLSAERAVELATALKVGLAQVEAEALAKEQAAKVAAVDKLIDRIVNPKVVQANPSVWAQLRKDFLADQSVDVVSRAMALGIPEMKARALADALMVEVQRIEQAKADAARKALLKRAEAIADGYLNPTKRAQAQKTEIRKATGAYLKDANFDIRGALAAIGIDGAVADKLVAGLDAERARLEADAKAKALARVVARLNPKSKKARNALPKIIRHLEDAVASGMWDDQTYLNAFADAFGLPMLTPEVRDRLRTMARQAMKAPAGPLRVEAVVALQNELAVFSGIKAADAFITGWYANMLSGLSTSGVNVFGNATTLLLRSIAVGISNPKDFRAYVAGLAKGFDVGLLKARQALKTGAVLKGADKYVQSSALELLTWQSPPLLRTLHMLAFFGQGKYVFRALAAQDALFYFSALEGRAHLAASRAARAKGFKPQSAQWYDAIANDLGLGDAHFQGLLQRAEADLIAVRGAGKFSRKDVRRLAWEYAERERSMDLRDEAERYAAFVTYTKEPEGIGKQVYDVISAAQRVPLVGRAFLPFAKILANIFEANLDFTGLGVLRGIRDRNLTDAKVDFHPMEGHERIVAGLIGTLSAAAIGAAAFANMDDNDEEVPFMIYGMGPKNKTTMPKGWKPYTIKIGGVYVPYAETPLAFVLAPIGALMDDLRYSDKLEKRGTWDRFAYAMASSMGAVTKMGVLSSLGNLMETLNGERSLGDTLGRAASAVIPGSGLTRDLMPLFDPSKITTDNLGAALLRDVPVIRGVVGRPALNIWGEPTFFEGAERLPVVKRFAIGKGEDPINLWLVRQKLTLPQLPKSIEVGQYLSAAQKWEEGVGLEEKEMNRISARMLTAAEQYQFAKRSGQLAKEGVQDLMAQVEPGDLDQKVMQSAVNKIFAAARSVAMKELVSEIE